MRQGFVAAVIAASIINASPALATRITSVAVKASLTSETAGACSSDPADYASFCASGSCVCDTYSGSVAGPLLGKGTIDISFTVDQEPLRQVPAWVVCRFLELRRLLRKGIRKLKT
jgi:hypothetical protein